MNLNESQRKAVECNDPRIAVIAGPGSGKTEVLVKRAARLAAGGERVLLLAFTRAVVSEMRRRVDDELLNELAGELVAEDDAKERIEIKTLHGAAYDIVSTLHRSLGFEHPPVIAGDEEVELLVKAVREELGYDVALKKIHAAMGGDMSGGEQAMLVASEVKTRLRAGCSLTYEQLIDAAGSLASEWQNNPGPIEGSTFGDEDLEALESIEHGRWDHVLVDEAQDLHRGLWHFLDALKPNNVFCVGDPRQSIFGFSGADPRAFLAWSADKATTVFLLQESYRMSPQLAEFANLNSPDAALASIVGIGPELPLGCLAVAALNEFDTSTLAQIEGPIAAGKQIAILARTNAELDGLEVDLARNAFRYYRIPRVGLDANKTIRVRARLRLLANQWDEGAVRILFQGDADRIVREAAAQGIAVGRHPEVGKLTGPDFFEFSQEAELLEAERADEAIARGWSHEDYLLSSIRKELTESEVAPITNASVTIATVHAAKGREWPVVVVLQRGFRMNNLDDRRCFYVAITRAKEQLILVP